MGIKLCTLKFSQEDLSNLLWDHPADLIRVSWDLEVHFYQKFCIQGLKPKTFLVLIQSDSLPAPAMTLHTDEIQKREREEGWIQVYPSTKENLEDWKPASHGLAVISDSLAAFVWKRFVRYFHCYSIEIT